MERNTIAGGVDYSWDISFARELVKAPAQCAVTIDGKKIKQDFQYYTRKERIR
ncbi:MAG: hypothetical protein ACO3M5_11385 [Saprospiraceae bacterium]